MVLMSLKLESKFFLLFFHLQENNKKNKGKITCDVQDENQKLFQLYVYCKYDSIDV